MAYILIPPVNEVTLLRVCHFVGHVENFAIEVTVEKLSIGLVAGGEVRLAGQAKVNLKAEQKVRYVNGYAKPWKYTKTAM